MRSPIQFYLYINTFIDELKKTDVDVGCRGRYRF